MADRRSFLRGLAALPLIGGSVALIGDPTAAAVPVTPDLMKSYKAWLFMEHRMLSFEMADHDLRRVQEVENTMWFEGRPGEDWHFQWKGDEKRDPTGWINAPQPSARAAVILSAAGVPLNGGRDHG